MTQNDAPVGAPNIPMPVGWYLSDPEILGDGETKTVTFPGITVGRAYAFVAGFNMGYDNTDHNIEGINVGVGVTGISNSDVTVLGNCRMWDNGGHQATGAVYFAVIAIVAKT